MAVERIVSSQVKNDLERWFADTYALWSQHTGGNWKLLGGYAPTEENTAELREILERDWSIYTLEDGIREINALLDKGRHHNPAEDAWDYCRAMQLLGLFFVVGFITREQMAGYCCQVGAVMQQHYHSWDELCASYLRGYERWIRQVMPDEAEQNIQFRRKLYESFRKMADGPYRVPWDLELVPPSTQEATGSYYQQWVKQEESWMRACRKKSLRRSLLIPGPFVLVFLTALMAGVRASEGASGSEIASGAVTGLISGIFVMALMALVLLRGFKQGRMADAIAQAVQALGLSELQQEQLGAELLDAANDRRCRLDFHMSGPQSQKTPARLLVSSGFCYLAGSYPLVILVDRSQLDYFEIGQEKKSVTVRRGNRPQTRIVPLYTIRFYYRASREARLEGSRLADAAMGFWSASIRDQAFHMMGGRSE